MAENTRENVKKSTGKKVLSIILDVILILYLLVAVLICVSVFTSKANDGVPSLFGYNFLTVETDSMETDDPDSIKKGDLIIGKKLNFEEAAKLKKGEIISFWGTIPAEDDDDKEIEIIKDHRIIEVVKGENGKVVGFITKGDKFGSDPDPMVTIGNVICKYTNKRISGFGNVIDFIKSPNGILICLVIPLAAFFIYAVFKFVRAFMEYKISKNPESVLTEDQKQKAIEEFLASQKPIDQAPLAGNDGSEEKNNPEQQ